MCGIEVALVILTVIIACAEIASRCKPKDGESKKPNPRRMKYVIALLLIMAGMLLFNYIARVLLLSVLLPFTFLMMFYYGFFWLIENSDSFRNRGKIFKVTGYALFMYWSIFLFEILQRIIKFLKSAYNYCTYEYEFSMLLYDIIDDVIGHVTMSVLFVVAVYLYKRYVSDTHN